MTILHKSIIRVPEVALIFWIIKTLSTTVGETGADFLAFNLGYGNLIVAIIMSTIMAVLLFLQFFKIKRYVPVSYWSMVVLMSIVGTLVTDILVDDVGISLVTLSIIFTIAMGLGFFVWHKNEKSLSIHTINTGKREAYYWLIILLAFALGTGVGDLVSEGLNLGYGTALVLFSGLIIAVTFAYFVLKINAVLAFWMAFILTRPLGASLGDYMTQSMPDGGLGLNAMNVNIVFLVLIVGLVTWLSVQQNRVVEIDV